MNDDNENVETLHPNTPTPYGLHPIDSALSLAREIGELISRWVKLASKEHELVIGAWVVHTWMRDGDNDLIFEATPYLNIHGQKNCGKSTLMNILKMLCFEPEEASSADGRTLAEIIHQLRPTLFMDEIDNMFASGSPQRFRLGLLNAGYKKESRGLPVRRNTELLWLRVFGPKVMAGRRNGYMADTLDSRCIPIPMMAKSPEDKLEPFRTRNIRPVCDEMRVKIEEWVEKNQAKVIRLLPYIEPIPGLDNRDDEITEPLRAIAMRMGIESEMRSALVKVFAKSDNPKNSDIEFLTDIYEAFEGQQRIESVELSARLGPGFEPMRLAEMLKEYGIEPRVLHMPHTQKSDRGYDVGDFTELLGIEPHEDSDQSETEAA